MSNLRRFRAARDGYFARAPGSPLTPAQKRSFAGLDYYPEAPDLIFDAELDTNVEPGDVILQTSTGSEQPCRRAGIVHFKVGDDAAQLTLYEPEEGGELFLPFRDAHVGTGNVRWRPYIDVRRPRNGRVQVDFNYAYDPQLRL